MASFSWNASGPFDMESVTRELVISLHSAASLRKK